MIVCANLKLRQQIRQHRRQAHSTVERQHACNRPQVAVAFLALLVFAGAPRDLAIAHEGHQMECKKTSMQAIKADIQAMNDGEAKRVAVKEMKMAEEMMDKNDMNACKTHLHNAMDAIDK